MIEFQTTDLVDLLSRTPAVLRALLAGLPEPWGTNNYGERTFSPFDVVGHLVHGEKADWVPRARIILDHGESRTFEPFDRYAMYEESRGKSLHDLLDEFERLRRANLEALRELHVTEKKLALRGRHPALGLVTLEQLLATWAAHDLNHIAQIAKALAFQYIEAVGPWRDYLSILSPPAVRAERSG